MSDLDNAINSINASAAKAENTATFLDDMSTFDDQSSVTNPNNGQTVASIPKQVKDRTDELFTAAESDINQAVSDAAQSATDAQDAADSVGRYQGLWPDTGGSANKGDTYQTQVSGTPTGQYFTALQNTTVDPVGDNANWREIVSVESIGGATNYQAASISDMVNGVTTGGVTVSHKINQVWSVFGTDFSSKSATPASVSDFTPIFDVDIKSFGATVGVDSTSQIESAKAYAESNSLNIAIHEKGHISTSTIQTKYTGNGSVLLADGVSPNSKYLKIFSGDTEKTVIPQACVIRQNSAGSGWEFIDDSGHAPNGFESIEIDSLDPTSLILNHKFNISKIGSTFAVPDEWYNQAGVTFGCSVSSGLTKVFARKSLACDVAISSGNVTTNGFFGSNVTAVNNGDGTVSIAHPTVLSATDRAIVCASNPASSGYRVIPNVISTSNNGAVVGFLAPMSFRVRFDGAWVVTSSMKNPPTVTADSTGLTITFDGALENLPSCGVAVGTGGIATLDNVSLTQARLVFRDFTGSVLDPSQATARGLSAVFTGQDLVLQSKAQTGAFSYYRDNVALNWSEVFGSTGNVWIGAIHDV